MIAAQAGTVVTNPAYAESIGIVPTISPEQLRGYILCCGPYNLQTLMRDKETGPLIKAALWAYAGKRKFMDDHYFVSNMTLTDFVTDTFLTSYVTVGNADPLGAQSKELVSVLQGQGVSHETLFYPDDHEPSLRHEYQFKLELADARTALGQILDFIRLRS
jgi:acetyl esterase/lipase